MDIYSQEFCRFLAAKYKIDQKKNDWVVEHKKNSAITYLINEKERIVFALMNPSVFELATEADLFFINPDDVNKFLMRFKYSGRAKCAEEDTFNLEKGKELARTRMLIKYYKHKGQLTIDYINYVANHMRKPMKQYHNCNRRLQELYEDLNELEN